MKKILFALSMLAFVVSALPQARGADVSMDFIYDNLSGGNWIDVEGYGYGWQPDVVVRDPNWRPYSDGYWAYTDYGWTWISYEDFGWATYHYGRWANLGGLRLDLVSGRRPGLGTGLGVVADWWGLHRLGAFAPARARRCL